MRGGSVGRWLDAPTYDGRKGAFVRVHPWNGSRTIEHSMEHSIEDSIEHSSEHSSEHSIEHSIENSIERSIEHSFGQVHPWNSSRTSGPNSKTQPLYRSHCTPAPYRSHCTAGTVPDRFRPSTARPSVARGTTLRAASVPSACAPASCPVQCLVLRPQLCTHISYGILVMAY